ncbi:UNVERIFIED_CONTAM: putative mitochondrial protein [Sesamum latifolium]|uniref:Mitochondrial protein n=1 Tax=Sesamum latifolium TaxID=2727402 RepID=A0AAW2WRF3_9LAMI
MIEIGTQKFFHASATARRRQDVINRIRDAEGNWREDIAGIQEVLLEYFRGIFTSSLPSNQELEAVLNTVRPKVMDAMNESLLLPFTEQECPAYFELWILLHKMNFTHIVLIPNALNLRSVISHTHLVFIPGRLITDNVLVTFEINHYVKNRTRGKSGSSALKFDISKAYDWVEWGFLRSILLRLGIHERFVRLNMNFVTSVTYSLMLNGSQFGYFRPHQGIRQGDPLSPYLFLFVAEAFSCMLQDAENRGEIQGITISREAPRVSHLLFANDTIIFEQAREDTMSAIKWILIAYGKASGQEINLEKSSMVLSQNLGIQERLRLAVILEVAVVERHDKYLGLPTVAGRSRGELFRAIKDKMWARIQGWNNKLLSQAGRGVLIKAVLQSIPTYVMSCFRLPNYLLHEIEMMIAEFWWHNKGERRTHWLGWSRFCQSRDEGGLGFKEMKAFNQVMLAKQGWRLITRPNALLSQILKAKYFHESSFLEASMGSRPSLTWRSLMEARDLLQQGCRRRIGSNEFTWYYDSKGHFSVRSAYKLEMKIKRRMRPSTSNSEANEENSERSR